MEETKNRASRGSQLKINYNDAELGKNKQTNKQTPTAGSEIVGLDHYR